MANPTSNRVIHLRLDAQHVPLFRQLYEQKEWHIAIQENFVWVKNNAKKVININPLYAIPSLLILEAFDGLLYPYGKQLPWGPLPELDWQPSQEALQVVLPDANPNFLGLMAAMQPRLIRAQQMSPSTALRVDLEPLYQWTNSAAAWRLQRLQWVVLTKEAATMPQALVLGQPLPPLQGQAYWTCGQSLLPLGYGLEGAAWQPILDQHIGSARYWLWEVVGTHCSIEAALMQPLSRSSLRQTWTDWTSSNVSSSLI